MKKFIFIIMVMMMPVVVFGSTCTVNKDVQTGNDKKLVCDAENRTTTTFRTTDEKTVLKNSVCEIKCTEEIVFAIDPIKKVLAGTSFNYPLYASGERKCKATYNYDSYEQKIKKLTEEYATLTGTAKVTKGNEITNYYAEKKECDEFTKEGSEFQNKYSYDGDVSLKLETSINEVTIPYVFVETEEYDSKVIVDEINYRGSCEFNEAGKTCSNGVKTINEWTETVRIFGKYTMKDTYIEKYTGEIQTVYSNNTCNAGDRYFVSMNELTRPTKADTTDKGYKLTLTANKLGNNLVSTEPIWNLNVDCWYQVKNLVFPQGGNGENTDDNYSKYGGTAFEYRLIDLEDPFPGREPGANWKGHESIITSTKDNLSSLERFVITLDRNRINRIREYNDVNSYDTFNLSEMEKSPFIEANPNIIDRK